MRIVVIEQAEVELVGQQFVEERKAKALHAPAEVHALRNPHMQLLSCFDSNDLGWLLALSVLLRWNNWTFVSKESPTTTTMSSSSGTHAQRDSTQHTNDVVEHKQPAMPNNKILLT